MNRTSLLIVISIYICHIAAGCAATGRNVLNYNVSNCSALDSCQQAYCDIRTDHRHYYSLQNLDNLTGGLIAAAALANTDADQNLQAWWQDDVRSQSTDDFSAFVKNFGEGEYVVAAAVAAMTVGHFWSDVPITSTTGKWGQNMARAYIVGTPPLILMQSVTGASRPGETSAGSAWKPFDDNNGASGHAFMGAVPFIVAAKMTDNPWLKATYYTGSTLTSWSRINDDDHYTSQAFLGWWMAYLACDCVAQTNQEARNYQFVPLMTNKGSGIGVMIRR